MATYVLSPGAWLSGSALQPGIGGNSQLQTPIGGNSPLDPGIGGNAQLQTPIGGNGQLDPGIGGNRALDPGIGGNRALDPGIGGNGPAARLMAAAARLTGAAPWRGTDPSWVYGSEPQALRAQALARSRDCLSYSTDMELPGAVRQRGMASATGPRVNPRPEALVAETTLWRWGRQPRVLAVVSDLNWRFAVEDACLWYLVKASNGGKQVTFEQSICLAGPPADARWYTEQIDKVQRAAVEREDRLPEILCQADGFLDFYGELLGISPAHTPATYEVLEAAQHWTLPLVMALKHQVAARRPYQVSTRILPVIETPTHGSLPSGHATTATFVSELLGRLMFGPDYAQHPRARQLDRLARRIAFNRVVAGVHFPVDSDAGYALGLQLAGHFIALATGEPPPGAYDFVYADRPSRELPEMGLRPSTLTTPRLRSSGGMEQSEPLSQLWEEACRELRRLRPAYAGVQS